MAGAILVFAGLISWYGATALQDKKEAKQSAVDATTATSDTTDATNQTSVVATDDRILLTPDNLVQYSKNTDGSPNCDVSFITTGSTEPTRYEDPVGRFEIMLPFNPDWGVESKYRIAAFDVLDKPSDDGTDEIKSTTQFGKMFVGEGCGWYRTSYLSVREQRSFEEIQAALADESLFATLKPRKTTVGDFTVAEYNLGGLCGTPTVEVIGDDYNITIGHVCSQDETERDQADLRRIVESLKLL